jgi:heat shock protein HslJ
MSFVRPWLWIGALLGAGACAVAPVPPGGGSAASAAPAAPAASLAGTRWVGVVAGVEDSRALPRLEFAPGGRISGYTGCNLLSGTWSEQGGVARFGAIASTKRMCLGPGGEIEQQVLAVLGDESRVTREGQRLVVTAPNGKRFEFAPAAAA